MLIPYSSFRIQAFFPLPRRLSRSFALPSLEVVQFSKLFCPDGFGLSEPLPSGEVVLS